nr:FtsX-like permease family protein [Kitasatospora sp. A2-31]
MLTIPAVALGQLRRRPAAFAGLAAAQLLALATVTLFGSLLAADLTAPAGTPRAATGPGVTIIAVGFGEIAVLVAFFVVVNALGFALRQQHRELALLRAAAATPRQIRRLVRGEVLATTLLVAPPGWALGHLAAERFLTALQRRDMAAPALTVPGSPLPALAALAAALLVGLAASAVGARRITRPAPAAALTVSSAEPGRTGVARLFAGVAVLAGGGLLLRLAATRPAAQLDKAGQAALLGTLVLLVALALLGPLAARLLVAGLGAPLRTAAPRTGWLADANLRGHAHRLAAAVVPVALLTGLSGTMTIMTTTAERAAERATAHAAELANGPAASSVTSASDVWLRQAELAMLVCFAAVATVNTLVALTVDRRREFALLRLAGATRRRLLAVLGVEAVLTAVVGVLLGAGVAAAASAAFSAAVIGTAVPAIPAAACGWIAAGALVLTLPGILLPALWATTGPAASLVAGGGRD